MASERFLIDTGPLVAFLSERDQHHEWAVDVLHHVQWPLYSCEQVISEACFLVQHLTGGPDAVLETIDRGLIDISFRLLSELSSVRQLVKRYTSVPMSLADACLVRMTELDSRPTVITLDSDFHIYRRHGRQQISTIMPT